MRSDIDARGSYDLSYLALTIWADQAALILIPLVVALMAVHYCSWTRSIQVSASAARSRGMVCHGVSNALIGGKGSQTETQCQTSISNRSERQSVRLWGSSDDNIYLLSRNPVGPVVRDAKPHSSLCGASFRTASWIDLVKGAGLIIK